MKLFTAILLLSMFAFGAASKKHQPFIPEVDQRFYEGEVRLDALEVLPNVAETTAYVGDGIMPLRIAKGRLNCALSSDCSIGSHSMGVSLPANAVIAKSFMHINSRFVDSGPGSVEITCEDTGNILASGDITGSLKDTVLSGVSSGDVSVMKSAIAASCVVTAAVGGVQPSSGDLSLFLEYVVHD